MSQPVLVGPLLQLFFTDHLVAQKRLSEQTIASYRDTFRLLLRFVHRETGVGPASLAIPALDAPSLLRFLDNIKQERDPRMMKPRQKISGTFRSFDALVDFRRIRGYVSTARKNGLNALDALRRVFLGNPFVPAVNTS